MQRFLTSSQVVLLFELLKDQILKSLISINMILFGKLPATS